MRHQVRNQRRRTFVNDRSIVEMCERTSKPGVHVGPGLAWGMVPHSTESAEGADIEVVKIALCAPRMNSVCERFLGGTRRECLDHIILLGEDDLRQMLQRYTKRYVNTGRAHQGFGQCNALRERFRPVRYCWKKALRSRC